VEAIGGGTVYTDRQMYTYIQYFRQLFKKHNGRVIDACEQGAFKEHAEHMSFAEALQQPFEKVDEDFSLLSDKPYQDLSRKDEIIKVFDDYIKEANRCLKFYDKCSAALDELTEHFDNKARRKKVMAEVETLKSKFNEYQMFSAMINELIQADDFQKQKDDLALAIGGFEGEELQLKQLERDYKFMKGMRGGLLYFKEFLLNGRRRLKIYPQTQSDEIHEDLNMIKEKVLKDES
jgi:hypothetical protein